MGIIKKMRGAISSKANAALDKAIDPAKELDIIVYDLETQKKKALDELLSYKATAKQMDASIESQEKQILLWEKRAMLAVKQGDDETAKECLKRKREAEVELRRIRADQAEAAGYAAELNRSRKELEVKLRILKLKKGTMATQIASARSGKGNAFAQSDELFAKMDEAERMIDEEVFAQEAAQDMLDGEAGDAELEAALLKAASEGGVVVDDSDPLKQLKAKMADEKQQKLLKE